MFDFEPRSQVVCVYEGPWFDWEGKNGQITCCPSQRKPPKKGSIYIVTGVYEIPIGSRLALTLEEFCHNHGFDAICFRPCKKTSIEQFRHHLVTPPKKLEPV